MIDNPDRTIPHALNRGLEAARGAFIIRMDAHAHYPPHYVERVVGRLRRGDVASVSGPQIAVGDTPGSRRVALALGTWLGTGGANFREMGADERPVDSGFTGGWSRETLERYGGWDPEWLINEDAELAARIRADDGRIVCVPDLAAEYIPRDNLRALAKQYFRYGIYRTKTAGRHPESLRPPQLLPPTVTLAVPVALLPGPVGKLGKGVLGVYALAVLATSAREVKESSVGDAARLPAVFATMHLSWGVGVLTGSARFGPPVRAWAHAFRGGLGMVAGLARRGR